MLLLCKHLSDDIQWFAWTEGALYVKEGDKMTAQLGKPQTLEAANSLINAYLVGRADAITSHTKANPS